MPPEGDRMVGRFSCIAWIMNMLPGMIVDHIHGNGLDNRKRYLRNGTRAQNSYNHSTPVQRHRFQGRQVRCPDRQVQSDRIGYKRRSIVASRGVRRSDLAGRSGIEKGELHGEYRLSEFPR